MLKITEEMIENNQNFINFENADSMFEALDSIIKAHGSEYIFKREHEIEEDCLRSYVLRSSVMRFSCDACEHYAKAILIQNGSSWDNLKSWGHNLLDLFSNLDEESRSLIISALMPNNYFNSDEYRLFNLSEEQNSIEVLYELLQKYNIIEEKVEKSKQFNLKHFNEINYYDTSSNIINLDEMIKTPIIYSDNIKALENGKSVTGELADLNPPKVSGQTKAQLLSIKSRFPGQYLVDGNAEFLVSLAYAFNQLCRYQRKKGESLNH